MANISMTLVCVLGPPVLPALQRARGRSITAIKYSYCDSDQAAGSAQHPSTPEAAGSIAPAKTNNKSSFFAITSQKVRRLFDITDRAPRLTGINSKEVY